MELLIMHLKSPRMLPSFYIGLLIQKWTNAKFWESRQCLLHLSCSAFLFGGKGSSGLISSLDKSSLSHKRYPLFFGLSIMFI